MIKMHKLIERLNEIVLIVTMVIMTIALVWIVSMAIITKDERGTLQQEKHYDCWATLIVTSDINQCDKQLD